MTFLTLTIDGTPWRITTDMTAFVDAERTAYYTHTTTGHFLYFRHGTQHLVLHGVRGASLRCAFHLSRVTRPDFGLHQLTQINRWRSGIVDLPVSPCGPPAWDGVLGTSSFCATTQGGVDGSAVVIKAPACEQSFELE